MLFDRQVQTEKSSIGYQLLDLLFKLERSISLQSIMSLSNDFVIGITRPTCALGNLDFNSTRLRRLEMAFPFRV